MEILFCVFAGVIIGFMASKILVKWNNKKIVLAAPKKIENQAKGVHIYGHEIKNMFIDGKKMDLDHELKREAQMAPVPEVLPNGN